MQVAGVKALRYGFTRTAVSGQTWSDMNGDAATEAGALYRPFWKNVAVGWAGVNDAVGRASAATIWSRMQTWAATMRGLGYKVVLCTEIDGQNVALNGVSWHGTIWPALNTLIAAGWSSVADGLADLGYQVTGVEPSARVLKVEQTKSPMLQHVELLEVIILNSKTRMARK